MRKQLLFHILSLSLMFCLLTTSIYGWWIGGTLGNSLIIRSANVETKITLYEGKDFNHDGYLDLDADDNGIYEEVSKTKKNKKQVLILNFDDILPTEVYTWKIKVENLGDVDGVVYATLYNDINIDGETESEVFDSMLLIKYMSITAMVIKPDGTIVKTKSNLYDFEKNKFNTDILFGNTTDYIINIGGTKEFVFQIQLEPLEYFNLDDDKLITEMKLYQSIQGVSVAEAFQFLDISLSSDIPNA